MPTPPFTAEHSVGRSRRRYRGARIHGGAAPGLVTGQLDGADMNGGEVEELAVFEFDDDDDQEDEVEVEGDQA